MKKFVRSDAYVRARLATGALFVVFGVAILFRTIADVGLTASAIPAYVLGAAMVALGIFRFRDYLAARRLR
ncbi:MAG: hypothetical protein NVSMB19_23200 [Vulcanimicrobiaceae bacterium]